MRWRWLLVGLALLASPSARAADCDDRTAIWTTEEQDGVRHLLYGTHGIGEEGAMFIEEWRGGRRAWRTLAGRATCSDGICTVRFEDVTPSDDVEAYVESVDENGDGLSDYVVLAGLGQDLYYGGGAKVEWDEGFLAKKYGSMFERPLPVSNVFKFLRCRTEPFALDQSTLYAEDHVYYKYRETGSLDADGTFPDDRGNDIWWMTGRQIEGWSSIAL